MFNNNSNNTKNKRTVKELLEDNPNEKVVFIDIKKEFDEVVKASKTNNPTEPINALEYYKP